MSCEPKTHLAILVAEAFYSDYRDRTDTLLDNREESRSYIWEYLAEFSDNLYILYHDKWYVGAWLSVETVVEAVGYLVDHLETYGWVSIDYPGLDKYLHTRMEDE